MGGCERLRSRFGIEIDIKTEIDIYIYISIYRILVSDIDIEVYKTVACVLTPVSLRVNFWPLFGSMPASRRASSRNTNTPSDVTPYSCPQKHNDKKAKSKKQKTKRNRGRREQRREEGKGGAGRELGTYRVRGCTTPRHKRMPRSAKQPLCRLKSTVGYTALPAGLTESRGSVAQWVVLYNRKHVRFSISC